MSTLSIARQRHPHHDEVEACFAALSHAARRHEAAGVDFDDVFDMDYRQPFLEDALVDEPTPAPSAARVRPAAARRTRVRLTRRGRVTVTLLFLATAMALMVPLAGLATATLSGGDPEPVRIVEVAPGDTLYGIAGEVAGPGEVRAVVHRIQELNSLPGGQIEVGQKLAVPVG